MIDNSNYQNVTLTNVVEPQYNQPTFTLSSDRGNTHLYTICKGGVKINKCDVNDALTFTSRDAANSYKNLHNLVDYVPVEV